MLTLFNNNVVVVYFLVCKKHLAKTKIKNSRFFFFFTSFAWLAFEREGKRSFRRERNARGARGRREGNA